MYLQPDALGLLEQVSPALVRPHWTQGRAVGEGQLVSPSLDGQRSAYGSGLAPKGNESLAVLFLDKLKVKEQSTATVEAHQCLFPSSLIAVAVRGVHMDVPHGGVT